MAWMCLFITCVLRKINDTAYITGETIFVDDGMKLYPGFE